MSKVQGQKSKVATDTTSTTPMIAQTFEDLTIWKNAREQANRVYDLFSADSLAARDFGFKDQIQRCAVSVMNNIAEGFERSSDPDFARFLDIAKGSNGEVRSMLYLAEDRQYLTPESAFNMRDISSTLSKSISALTKHLRHGDSHPKTNRISG